MRRLSFKAVLSGVLADLALTFAFGVVFSLVLMVSHGLFRHPAETMSAEIATIIEGNAALRAVQVMYGFLASIVGGHLAARLAKRDEILHGAAVSLLSIVLGIYAIATETSASGAWLNVLLILCSPLACAFGGYLALLRKSAQGREPASTRPAPSPEVSRAGSDPFEPPST